MCVTAALRSYFGAPSLCAFVFVVHSRTVCSMAQTVSCASSPKTRRKSLRSWLLAKTSQGESRLVFSLLCCDLAHAQSVVVACTNLPAAGVMQVLGVSKLRSDFKPYESKRQLCASYDMFLCDDR